MTSLYHQRYNNIAQESRECFFRTMSSVLGAHATIDSLIQSSLESKHKFEWVSNSDITDIKPSQIDNVHYAARNDYKIIMVFFGSSEECTPALVSELARINSFPTHEYDNDVSQFRRYKKWLMERIQGFTKYYYYCFV